MKHNESISRQKSDEAREMGGDTPVAGADTTPPVDFSLGASPASITPNFQLPGAAFKQKKSDSVGFEPPTGFQIVEVIGKGGMGVVYRAIETAFGRDVALKVLHEKTADSQMSLRFLEEARITGQLQHPGIPSAYRVGFLSNNQPFLAMKLIRGKALNELLMEEGPSSNRWLSIFEGICQAVGYAHSKGVIHRDLKPHNVMVGAFGEVQVMDWGLAKVVTDENIPGEHATNPIATPTLFSPFPANLNSVSARVPESLSPALMETARPPSVTQESDQQPAVLAEKNDKAISSTGGDNRAATDRGSWGEERIKATPVYQATVMGSVIGTPAYMSPEQASGEISRINIASDVFGLGAIFVSLLTGKPPYVAATVDEVLEQAKRGELQACFRRLDSSQADPEIITLCRSCLALAPRDRPQDGAEVARSLERIRLAAEGRMRQAETDRERAKIETLEAKRRRKNLIVAGGLLCFVLAAGFIGTAAGWIEAQKQREFAEQAAEQESERATSEERAKRRAEEAAQAEREANELTQRRLKQIQAINQLVFDIFRDLNIRKLGADSEPVEALLAKRLVVAGQRVDEELVGDPETTANLLHQLGTSLHSLGYPVEAIPLYEQAHEIREPLLGKNHRETLASQLNLAEALDDSGQHQPALEIKKLVSEQMELLLGIEHPDTLMARANLATSHSNLGNHSDALPLFTDVLAARKRVLGPEHFDTLTSVNNLGFCFLELGRYDEAMTLFQDAMPIFERVLGPSHYDTLFASANYLRCLERLEKYEEALRLGEVKAAQAQTSLGRTHHVALVLTRSLAMMYWKTGQKRRAMELIDQVLNWTHERFGPDHLESWKSLETKLEFVVSSRHAGDHLPQAQQLVAGSIEQLGERHPDTIHRQRILADLLCLSRKIEEAVPILESVVAYYRETLGHDHPKTLMGMNDLALAYLETDQIEKSVKMLQEALELKRARFGDRHRETLVAVTNQAALFRQIGRVDLAIPLFEESLAVSIEEAGPSSEVALGAKYNLAVAYFSIQQYDKAIELFERFRVHWREAPEPNMPLFADLQLVFARRFFLAKQYAVPGPWLAECVDLFAQHEPKGWKLAAAQAMLGRAALENGDHETAERLLLLGHQALVEVQADLDPGDKSLISDTVQWLIQFYNATGNVTAAAQWQQTLETVDH
jgi:serine/threonine protein kinase